MANLLLTGRCCTCGSDVEMYRLCCVETSPPSSHHGRQTVDAENCPSLCFVHEKPRRMLRAAAAAEAADDASQS